MQKIIFIACMVLFCWHVDSQASEKDAGKTTAAFLKLGGSIRAAGMGSAYAAVDSDIGAVYWNPAGLASIKVRQASFLHMKWFEDTNMEYLNGILPVMNGVLSGGIIYLGHDNIHGYDKDANPSGDFSANDLCLIASYARGLLDEWYGGINVKIIKQRLEEEKATGIALDMGVIYPQENMNIGVCLQNLGSKIKLIQHSNSLPLNLKAGVSYYTAKNCLLTGDINLPVDNKINIALGAEYVYQDMLAGRIGYRSGPSNIGSGISAGVGIKWRDMGFDYAYIPYGKLGDTHQIGVCLRFGQKAELPVKIPVKKDATLHGNGTSTPAGAAPVPKPMEDKNVVRMKLEIAKQGYYRQGMTEPSLPAGTETVSSPATDLQPVADISSTTDLSSPTDVPLAADILPVADLLHSEPESEKGMESEEVAEEDEILIDQEVSEPSLPAGTETVVSPLEPEPGKVGEVLVEKEEAQLSDDSVDNKPIAVVLKTGLALWESHPEQSAEIVIIKDLDNDTKLVVIDDSQENYYKVETPDGVKGWVARSGVRLLQ